MFADEGPLAKIVTISTVHGLSGTAYIYPSGTPTTSLDPSHCHLLKHNPITQKFILIFPLPHIRWEYNVKRILNK
jgi:hypothetical protein